MEDFKVYVATWNVSAKSPLDSENLRELLGLKPSADTYLDIPDLYVIGLQEVKAQPQNVIWNSIFEDPWIEKIKEILSVLGLVKVTTGRLQGIQTSLFVKRAHLVHLRDIETLFTRRGFGGIWGNKGAVSTSLGLYGVSICLVNCHLTPHDELIEERIEDYKQILTTTTFSSPPTSNILFHDYVFWFGDFNFRLNGPHSSSQISNQIGKGELKDLLNEDQLISVQKTGDAFSELTELPINFPPSYKYEHGYDSYDLKRRPAWTDRILFYTNTNAYDNVKLSTIGKNYTSFLNYRASDHRPVVASFTIKIFTPTPTSFLIHFSNLDNFTWAIGHKNKITYQINRNLETSPTDWVGIYRADFKSLDEYVSYVYVGAKNMGQNSKNSEISLNEVQKAQNMPSFSNLGLNSENSTQEEQEDENEENFENSGEYKVKFLEFSEILLSTPGNYVFIYFSKSPRSVYAISSEFTAKKSRGEAGDEFD